MKRDIGAGDIAMAGNAAEGIDGEDQDLVGALEDRQGVVDGARGATAGVPRHHHPLADTLEAAMMGHDENRAADIENDDARQFRRGAGIEPFRIALAEDGEVGIARIEGNQIRDIAFDAPPFRRQPRAVGVGGEHARGVLGGLADIAVVGLDQFRAEIGFGELMDRGKPDDIKADQMGVMGLGEIDGEVESGRTARRAVDMNKEILQRHDGISWQVRRGHGVFYRWCRGPREIGR